jgi:hypothetical protein
MKTADRENQIHGVTWSRNRAHGAVGQNRTRSIKWAEKQEKFRPKEMCFFLTSPFIVRTYQDLAAVSFPDLLLQFFAPACVSYHPLQLNSWESLCLLDSQ